MPATATPSTNFCVVVLDEDRDLCRQVTATLSELGCRVVCLPLHSSAWQIRELDPDLLLLDVSLPNSPEMDLFRRLQNQRGAHRVPVIVTSPHEELEYELLDVFDFLAKPLDLKRLSEDVQLVMKQGRQLALSPPPPEPEVLRLFQDFLLLHSGLHFDRHNHKILERGLTHRMRAVAAVDFPGYFAYLTKFHETRKELKKLLGLLTIGETFFFRYQAHFDALRDKVLPELIVRRAGERRLRLWSAGCSTGEEPYTLALLLLEHFPQLRDWDITILATDINKRALHRARDGIYRDRSLRLVEPQLLAKYFHPVATGHQIDPAVRRLVKFAFLNLQTGHYPTAVTETSDIDLVFCRNVMIYFRIETMRAVVERFSRALRPGGYLFLGHAETLANISEAFQRTQQHGGFYYRLKELRCDSAPLPIPAARPAAEQQPRRNEPLFATPAAPVVPTPQPPVVAAPPERLSTEKLLQEADRDFQQENYRTAYQKYDTILAYEPQHVGALVGKGFTLANSGDAAAALTVCTQILHLDDLCPQAYFLRGLIADQHGDLPAAAADYRKALLLDMNFIMPHYSLGRLAWRAGRTSEAQRHLRNTLRLLGKLAADTVIPYSGGLTRAVFQEQCRDDLQRLDDSVA